jgi:tRNA(Ile)-lysidine synthase
MPGAGSRSDPGRGQEPDGGGPGVRSADGPTGRKPPSRRARAHADDEAAALADGLLARCHFPQPSAGPVTLAVSGGPDSLALLVLAARAGLAGTAVHVDHGLRPGSASESDLVAQAAGRFGFAFARHSFVITPGPDLEARARQARYAVLPAGVMTGHTMDDQAETVLLNVLRGAGLDGLAGMKVDGQGRPRRPLLALRRHETESLCAAFGLDPLVDPSNQDPRFRRNRVRAEVLPLLCDVASRDVVPILARQAGILAGDASVLDKLADGIDATDAKALSQAPPPLARRAVRRWLRSADAFPDAESHPPSSAEVARVLAVADGTVRACELEGGRRVVRSRGRLHIAAASLGPA